MTASSPGLIIGRPLRLDSHSYQVLSRAQLDLVGLVALCLAKDQQGILGVGVQHLRVNQVIIEPERSLCLSERMFNFHIKLGAGRAAIRTGLATG